jgi:general secretion pathway protein N
MNVNLLLPVSLALAILGASDTKSESPLVSAALEKDFRQIDGPGASGIATSPAAPTDAAENPLQSIPLSSLSATRERPLFSATRRPPPAAPAPEAARAPEPVEATPVKQPENDPPPPLALIGTITGTGRPVAILFNRASRTVSQVREGDEELGWRITVVSARSAVAEKDGNTVTLDLPRPTDPVESLPENGPDQQN